MIGSGKTTLGERLAARLGRAFVDLDREMDRALGHSFHRLVEERGWLAFRELEYAIVKRLAGMHDVVAALGGGALPRRRGCHLPHRHRAERRRRGRRSGRAARPAPVTRRARVRAFRAT